VGKVHVRDRAWIPLQIDFLPSQPWYEAFNKERKRFIFDMQGAGPWDVLFFREESDESGLYVAVGLRNLAEMPDWLPSQRRLDGV
jgi:hypothetical protein